MPEISPVGVSAGASQPASAESTIDPEFLRSLSILYVEDEAEVREGLAHFLRRRFGRVDLAANGKEGLELFRQSHQDVVITDVRMPVMDGLEMAVRIKQIQHEVPVIVVTAYNEVDYFMRAIELGVDRYVKKPIDPEELVEAIYTSARIRFHERELGRSRRHQLEILQRTVGALARAIEKRDVYTDGHQKRVAQLAVAIAAEMGLPEETIDGIRFGALIHEVGNITIPSEILSTPRQLSPVELDMIKGHTKAGVEIVGDIEFPWPIAQIILHHHEKLDGSGYPDGLVGDEISLETRVVTVACVVEAMASHRPYREALGLDAALEEIRSGRGKLYDPAVVDACARVLERSGPGFW